MPPFSHAPHQWISFGPQTFSPLAKDRKPTDSRMGITKGKDDWQIVWNLGVAAKSTTVSQYDNEIRASTHTSSEITSVTIEETSSTAFHGAFL